MKGTQNLFKGKDQIPCGWTPPPPAAATLVSSCLNLPAPTRHISLDFSYSVLFPIVQHSPTLTPFFPFLILPGWLLNFFFFNLIFILYWSIVDLQCCVSFRCTESDSVIHTPISILFQILFPYRLLRNIE